MQAALGLVAALVLAACATGGAAGEGSAPGPAAAAPNACERAPLAAGVTEHRLESSGVARRFLLRVPSAAFGQKLPIVFNLHGSGGTPEDQLALSGLGELADAQGFVLVAPEGYERMWNVPPDASKPDDVRFIADALDAVGALLCVDAARVYSTGFSGGGRMSSQLACDLSVRIAAIAAIGGIRFPGPCAQARPFPVLAFHGTADDVNPYDGGGRPYWGTSVEAAVSGWATHNGCPTRTDQEVSSGIQRIAYTGGSACSEVVLYRIEGLGHVWPPGALATAAAPTGGESTTNQLLWSFFTRHPLP